MPSDRSNLENLARARQLHAEPPDEREIAKLLAAAQRLLRDARIPKISADGRFSVAYNAAHSLALAALRAAGYRPVGPGHRRILFQVLEFTAGASRRLSVALAQHHDRRNKVEYEASDPTELEATDLLELALELEALVVKRLKT
jgi:hypothetical protein